VRLSAARRARSQTDAAFEAPVIVAVPVRDEAERIADCLHALAWQKEIRAHEILLLLNNCTDDTAAVVRDIAPGLPVPVHAVESVLSQERANAGHARRLAMRHAAERAGAHGVLLTTDADGRVAPDWVAANLAAIRDGAEAVAGRTEIDPVEARRFPAHLQADDALERAYADRLDEIDWLVDPDPADPWPRHSEDSGASIAVTCAAYHRAGGVPAVALGEDRRFIDRLRRVDAAIRHAPETRVVVSGRVDGRARGGMADTRRRRIVRQDEWIDDRLEPAFIRLRRAMLRRRFRVARDSATCPPSLARELCLSPGALAASLAFPFLGAGWAEVEAQTPVLRRQRVRRIGLAREAVVADAILASLRASPLNVPAPMVLLTDATRGPTVRCGEKLLHRTSSFASAGCPR
jgi:glycosyltransferase involved in cell wall biosynthesis